MPDVSAAQLIARLRARYPSPAWALFTEVGDAANRSRSADAVAMSLWASRGMEVHGFEIKVSRPDWRRELADPAKAEAIQQWCDRWWLVVGDETIVKAGELPPTWGLLVPRGAGLHVAVDAPKLDPQPLSRPFVGALVRAAAKAAPAEVIIKQARLESYQEGFAKGRESGIGESEQAAQNSVRLEASVAEFEKASGIGINHWNGGNLGKAVALVLKFYAREPRQMIEHLRDQAAKTTKELEELLRALAKYEPLV